MKLEFAIEYAGQRIINNGMDCPIYEVSTQEGKRLCLTMDDVKAHVCDTIDQNDEELLKP